MFRKIIPILTCVFFFSIPSFCWGWSAKVLRVIDGDTIVVAPGGDEDTPITVRLYGIDAPEANQDGGDKASAWLQKKLRKKAKVEIIDYDIDQYGRMVSLVIYDESCVNQQLLKEGHAWVYPQFCKANFCRKWKKIEAKARDDEEGLWDKKAIAPWTWRAKNKKDRKYKKDDEDDDD